MGRKILKGLFILALIGIYGIVAIIPTFGYLVTLAIATYIVMDGILLLADKVFDKEKSKDKYDMVYDNEYDDYDYEDEDFELDDLDYCECCGHIMEFCTCNEEEV
jgi:hypothetical protein